MDSWPYFPAHTLSNCPTSSHPPKSPPFRQPVSPRPTSRLPRAAEDADRMLVDCDDCLLPPPCCLGSPAPSTSVLPSTQNPLAFCCEEPSCLVSEQTCQGGAACPSAGFVGWDEMLAADGECEQCEAGVELGAGDGCCKDSPFSPVRTPFDSFNECCTEDCFGPVGQGAGGPKGIELDCPDCWEVGGGVGGSGTAAMAALSMAKDEELTETNSSVATPADASPDQGFGKLLQNMDEKALQDILDCCCCGPDISQTHTFDPSHHPYAHQHHLEPNPSTIFAVPPPHLFHPSLLPPPISFPCKWSDCNLFFATKDALAIHVNGDHLAFTVAPTLPMYGPPPINPAKCLWDSCETPAWATPLPVPSLPVAVTAPTPFSTPASASAPVAVPVDDKIQEATSNLLQHLLNDHLAKLEPGIASAITASIASHSPHLLSHPSSTLASAHPHLHPHSHPHPHAHPHRHRHASHPYGVHSRAPSTTPSLSSVPGSHPCLWRECTLIFGSTSELMSHLSSDHVGSGKASYVCEWDGCERCGDKGFAQRQKVMRHLQTHTGDRPFVCETCGKSFSEATTLTQHIRVHTNERPYKCTHEGCEKAFSLASALTIHSRIHTGAKPFLCPHPGCTSAFSESSNLSKHVRTHKGEKGYPCDECGKAFSRSDQLARHKKIHARARGEEVS